MSGSKPTQSRFEEEFQALEREEKRLRLLERAEAMRPMRMKTLESLGSGPDKQATLARGRTTF